jgi:two-component system, cell cycle sensor histidine kinase and response regulator CckA
VTATGIDGSDGSRRAPRASRPPSLAPAAALAVVVVALVAFGALYLVPYERRQTLAAVKGRLSALAEDRKDSIEAWIGERRSDSLLVASLPVVSELLSAGDADTSEATSVLAHAVRELDGISRTIACRSVYVVAPDGTVVAASTGSPPLDPGAAARSQEACGRGEPLLGDFWRGAGGALSLAFIAPVVAETDTPEAQAGLPVRPLGAVLLEVDPEAWLFPLLCREPSPTQTREALLAGRRGDQVVFLSPLRHREGAPLSLSLAAADNPRLAALVAVSSPRSFGELLDYRGKAVFAATRQIAGTPWGLVVKVDRDEAFEDFRRTVGRHALVSVGALLALLLVGHGLWRARHATLEAEMARSEARLGALLENAQDIVLFGKLDGTLVDCNAAAVQAYGYPKQELLRLRVSDLRAAEARSTVAADFETMRMTGSVRYEARHVRKDGTTFPVEVVATLAVRDPEPLTVAVVRDMTAHVRAEARIHLLNRLLRTITEISQLIVRERSIGRLFAEVCRIVVEHGEMRMAWIGELQPATGEVRPVAQFGESGEYVEGITVRADDTPAGRGPTGRAIREGHSVIADDWDSSDDMAPWRERGRRYGYRASAAFPLSAAGVVVGALNVYSTEPGVFTGEVRALFDEMAADLSFALGAIQAREARSRAEQALSASERSYRELFDSMDDAVLIVDMDAAILAANRAAIERYGFPLAALTTMTVRDIDTPAAAEVVSARVTLLKEHGHLVFETEQRRRDGTPIPTEVSSRIVDYQGRPAILSICRDITERRNAEEDRRRLVAAIEQSAETIVITDIEGRILYVNPAFTSVTGYSSDEVLGMHPRILSSGKHSQDFHRQRWETLLAGQTWRGRVVNRRKDGSLYEEEATLSPVRDSSGRIVNCVSVGRDITQQIALEEQVRHSQKMEAVGSLAGGVAHDFNNLLQAMQSVVEILRVHRTDPERAVASLAELDESIRRGAHLTRQLLLFSRRDATSPESLELDAVLGGTANMLRRLLRENIAMAIELDAPGRWVEVDRGQIEQVVINLAVNAADAMPAGGALTVRSGFEEAAVWFEVEDTGSGIPARIRSRIFEPFFTTKGRGQGSGLGLSVVHGIVTAHRGEVEVSSELGQGTRVRIRLPQAAEARREAEAAPGGVPELLAKGRGERILLVEDEPGTRQGLCEILTLLGYRPVAVESGEEALALPAFEPFDLLLTDVMLPGIAGPEVAFLLRSRWPSLQVVLMSGYAEDEADRRFVAIGCVRYLQKPFDMAALSKALRAALEG